MLILGFLGCAAPPTSSPTPTATPTSIPAPSKAHPNLFVNQDEINQIKLNVFTHRYSWAVNAYNSVKRDADSRRGISVPAGRVDDRSAMFCARDSAVVYALSGDTSYAEEGKRILMIYANDLSRGQKTVLSQAQWLSGLALAYDLIYNYHGLSASDKSKIENMLKYQAQWIIDNAWCQDYCPSNHKSWMIAGIASAGYATGDQNLIYKAVESPNYGFKYLICNSILDDGTFWEGSPGYAYYALEGDLIVAEAAWHSGTNLYTYQCNGHTLKMLFDTPLLYVDPNLMTPGNGDANAEDISKIGLYEIGYLRYNDPAYGWLLGKSNRDYYDGYIFGYNIQLLFGRAITSTRIPESPSINLGDIGWGILKSAPPAQYFFSDSLYVMLDYGPHAGDHDHADKLNIDIVGYGHRIAEDKSMYAYGDGRARGVGDEGSRHFLWDRQTIAHNTVVVDKQSMPGAENMFDGNGVSGQFMFFDVKPTLKVIQASADTAYSGVGYRRIVAMTDYYIIDIFRLNSSAPHIYDWALHANDRDRALETSLSLTSSSLGATTEGYQFITDVKKATTSSQWTVKWQGVEGETWNGGLKTIMLDSPNTEVFVGLCPGGPHTQRGGWGPDPNDEPSKIPIVIARRNVANTVFVAVHEPYAASPQITSLTKLTDTLGEVGVKIQTSSLMDIVLLDQDYASANSYGPYLFDGKAVLIRKDPSNRLMKISMMHGTSLNEGGIEFVKSSNSIASFEIAFSYQSRRLEITSGDSATLTIYTPVSDGISSIYVNNQPTSFIRSGDYVIVNLTKLVGISSTPL
jgi:hypothetical protein